VTEKRRAQIREGGRWKHRGTGRSAIVTRIHYPGFVEYKYERPTRSKDPWHGYMTTDPYTRRTRVSYGSFVTSFDHVKKERR
jgi:hypothetical protein